MPMDNIFSSQAPCSLEPPDVHRGHPRSFELVGSRASSSGVALNHFKFAVPYGPNA
jgi:hypothetical protein